MRTAGAYYPVDAAVEWPLHLLPCHRRISGVPEIPASASRVSFPGEAGTMSPETNSSTAQPPVAPAAESEHFAEEISSSAAPSGTPEQSCAEIVPDPSAQPEPQVAT